MVEISEHMKGLLDQIVKKEDIQDAKYELSKGSEKGDNYIGEMVAVDVTGKDKTGKELTLHLMAKKSPKNEALRSQMPIRKIYEEEIFIYETLLPIFKSFEKDVGTTDCFDGIAKCYISSMDDKNETLIFENLSFNGYRMWNRMKPMDEKHVKLILDQYAHFHSFSLCIKDQKPELFEEIKQKIVPTMTLDDIDKYMKGYDDTFEYLIETFNDDKAAVDFLKQLKASFRNICMKLMQPTDKDVVTHGDCWCNNMMFKYDDKVSAENPKHIVIVDWQMSRVAQIHSDLCYFFYCSASQDIIDNYQEYQKYYYDRLSRYCANMGSDITKLYTFTEFAKDWDQYRIMGLGIATLMMRVMVTEKSEAIDLEKSAEKENFIMDAFNYKSVNEDKFLRRIKDLIDHFVNTFTFEN